VVEKREGQSVAIDATANNKIRIKKLIQSQNYEIFTIKKHREHKMNYASFKKIEIVFGVIDKSRNAWDNNFV
jgi:hypothetical protein